MKKSLILICLIILFSSPRELYGWENELTHPAITEQAIGSQSIDQYLQNQLGLSDGLSTQLYWDFPSDQIQEANNARKWL